MAVQVNDHEEYLAKISPRAIFGIIEPKDATCKILLAENTFCFIRIWSTESKKSMGVSLTEGTGTTQKMSQRYFCPAEYTLGQNLKLTLKLTLTLTLKTKQQQQQRTKLRVRVRVFWLVLS